MARPSKLTPAVQETIIKAIGLGGSYADACLAAGISYDTLNNWKRRAEDGEAKYLRLFGEIASEEARAVLRHLAVMNNAAAKGEWKASLEWLRRRRRADWGDNVDLTTNGEKLEIVLRKASDIETGTDDK